MKKIWKSTPLNSGMERSTFLPGTDQMKRNCNVLFSSRGQLERTGTQRSPVMPQQHSKAAPLQSDTEFCWSCESLECKEINSSFLKVQPWDHHKVPLRERRDTPSSKETRMTRHTRLSSHSVGTCTWITTLSLHWWDLYCLHPSASDTHCNTRK